MSEAEEVEARKAYKLEYEEAISIFNKKPEKGIKRLLTSNKIEDDPERIADFLLTCQELDLIKIGEYLGERDDRAIEVRYTVFEGALCLDWLILLPPLPCSAGYACVCGKARFQRAGDRRCP